MQGYTNISSKITKEVHAMTKLEKVAAEVKELIDNATPEERAEALEFIRSRAEKGNQGTPA